MIALRSLFMILLKGMAKETVAAATLVGVRCSLVLGIVLISSAAQARTQEQEKCGSSVTVGPGDSLSLLAQRCGTTVPALIEANSRLKNPDLLPIGTVIALPGSSGKKEDAPSDASTVADAVAVEPATLLPGKRVTIMASGLPARARVWIKGGNSRLPQHHLILRGARVGTHGELRATLRVPKWMKAGNGAYTLSIVVPRTSTTLLSAPLTVVSSSQASKDR
jgi:LysM repeat protein